MNTVLKTKKKTAQRMIFNKKVFWMLLALIFVSTASYGFLINKIIWNVVARQKAEASVSLLGSQVSTLESSYITLSNAITIDKAYQLGFKDVSDKSVTYISRADTATVLSMRTTDY